MAPTNASPYATPGASLQELQVIIKTVERCNLACPYCYYFFSGDESYRKRPPVISLDTVAQIANYVAEGVRDYAIRSVRVIFHGGEPTLQKPDQFGRMCEILKDAIAPLARVRFAMQTNGVHLPDAWMAQLVRHHVHVGVSVDGPPPIHDLTRIDHRGRGSYARVEQTLDRLIAERNQGHLDGVGTISVMQPGAPAVETMKHLMARFDMRLVSFLFPDATVDEGVPGSASALEYGKQLCDVFDHWMATGRARVVQIDHFLRFLQVYARADETPDADRDVRNSKTQFQTEAIVFQSNGDITIDDSLFSVHAWRTRAAKLDVRHSRLRDFLESELVGELAHARRSIPTACRDCTWREMCRGGDVENRFSTERGFDNPSVYCEGLKLFCAHVAERLVSSGYPADLLNRKLSGDLHAAA